MICLNCVSVTQCDVVWYSGTLWCLCFFCVFCCFRLRWANAGIPPELAAAKPWQIWAAQQLGAISKVSYQWVGFEKTINMWCVCIYIYIHIIYYYTILYYIILYYIILYCIILYSPRFAWGGRPHRRFFLSVTGAKGGVEHEGLPLLGTLPMGAFYLFPRVGASQAREFQIAATTTPRKTVQTTFCTVSCIFFHKILQIPCFWKCVACFCNVFLLHLSP